MRGKNLERGIVGSIVRFGATNGGHVLLVGEDWIFEGRKRWFVEGDEIPGDGIFGVNAGLARSESVEGWGQSRWGNMRAVVNGWWA